MSPSPSYISRLSLVMVQVHQGLAEDHSSMAAATIVEHATANSGLRATSSIIDFVGIVGFADTADIVKLVATLAATAAKLQAITAINLATGSDRDFTTRAAAGSADLAVVHTAMAQITEAGNAVIARPHFLQSIIQHFCCCMAN